MWFANITTWLEISITMFDNNLVSSVAPYAPRIDAISPVQADHLDDEPEASVKSK